MKYKKIDNSVSVVVPAYNEEESLEEAVKSLLSVLDGRFKDYEVLIFNDCSSDKTGKIADKLSLKNRRIKVIHNKTNKGLGYNYMRGAEMASMDYFSFFPGDNENSAKSFYDVLKEISKADIIIPYPMNMKIRAKHRRIISELYTFLLNKMFNLNLRYYNGTVVYKTSLLKSVKITTFGFAYSAEILIKLLKKNVKYEEVGVKINPSGKSSAFRLKNIISVIKTILSLFYEINIWNRKKYR